MKAKATAYASLFWEFFKIGMLTIGGGVAMIPQLQQTAVKDKGWLSHEEMLDCIALGQSLPGVIAVNMATFIGHKLKGLSGAVVATLGVILPAFISMIIVLTLLDAIGDNAYVSGAFTGVKASVCGLIGVTAVSLLKQMRGSDRKKNLFNAIMAVLSFVAVGVFGITAILVILAGIIIGIVFNCLVFDRKSHERSGEVGR